MTNIKLIWIFVFLILISSVTGLTIDDFNNTENFTNTFYNNGTTLAYIRIPTYSNFSTSTLNAIGYRSPIINQTFYDAFNRSDGSYIGNNWYNGTSASLGANNLHCKTNISGNRSLLIRITNGVCTSHIYREISNKTNSSFNLTLDFELEGSSRRLGVDLYSNTSGATDEGIGFAIIYYAAPSNTIELYKNGTYIDQWTGITMNTNFNYSTKIHYKNDNLSIKVWNRGATEPESNDVSYITDIPYNGEAHNNFYFFGSSSGTSLGRTYIDDINISFEGYSYLTNLKAFIGDDNNNNYLNFTSYFTNDTDVNQFYNFTEVINNATIIDGCNCTNCLNVDNYCYMPINISTDTPGYLEFYNLSLIYNYTFELTNCSDYGTPSLNISFYEDIVNTDISVNTTTYINYSVYDTSNLLTMRRGSVDSMEVCVYPLKANISGDLSIYYTNETYSTHLYEENNYIFDTKLNFLELYLYNLSNTDKVTAIVYNEIGDTQENAYIHVLRYNPSDNTYSEVQLIDTNFNGQAELFLQKDDQYYKFAIDYPLGTQRYISERSYVFSDTITFKINTQDNPLDTYYNVADILFQLYNGSNTFTFSYTDSNNVGEQFCLDVYQLSGLLYKTLFNSSCLTTSTGIIELGVAVTNGTSYYAKAYTIIDSQNFYLGTSYITYKEVNAFNDSKWGWFILFAVTLGFIFLTYKSIYAMLLVPIPMIIASYIEIIPLPMMYGIIAEILAFVLVLVIKK